MTHSNASRLLDEIAAQAVPETLDLNDRISAYFAHQPLQIRTDGRNDNNWRIFVHTLRSKPLLTIFLALLAIALVTGAAYALGRLSGYIPGFGFSQDTSAALTLLEPVEITRDGLTLRVLQALGDSQRFSVTIQQSGTLLSDSQSAQPSLVITLPDGRPLEFVEGSGSQDGSFLVNTFHFAALPADVRDLSLHYTISQPDQNILWQAEFHLRLRSLRADEQLPALPSPLAESSHGGLSLRLETAARSADFTLLELALRFERRASLSGDWNVVLSDSQGRFYPLQLVNADSENTHKTYRAPALPGSTEFLLTLTVFPDPHNLKAIDLDTGQAFSLQGEEWALFWRSPAEWDSPQAALTLPVTATAPIPVEPALLSLPAAWQQLSNLATQNDQHWRVGAGWIHYVTSTETLSNAQGYPPPFIVTEQWLEVDAQGWVLRSVYSDSDQQGNLLQQSLAVGNYGINLTTGEAFTDIAPWQFSADWLTPELQSAVKSGADLVIESAPCPDTENETCWQLTFRESLPAPVQNPGQNVSYQGAGRRIWMRERDGAVIRQQAFWRLEDGSERVDFTQTLLLLEKLAAPPPEVLDLLAKVIVP
ncbi:MAG: hypothetical protein OHK0031_10420 [Anaerolineales bacterium]